MNPIRRHRLALALLSVPVALSLAACGTSDGSDSSSMSSADSGSGGSAAEPAPASDGAARLDNPGNAKAVDAVIQRSVIATGSLSLTSRHLADVRGDAIDLVEGLGGHVADEQSQSDSRGRLDRVDLTLRVPAASFDRALDALGRLGTVRHRQQSVQDVTTQVIDNNARVKAQEQSVSSIQRLLARANTIAEIMSIESQLASRQAELDSLKQQQKWLADQTSLSTVRLGVTRPAQHEVSEAGFLGGLERGWHALGRSMVALGTAVGAVLPFAVVLALVGVPLWLLVRRRRTPVVAAAPAAEGS